MASKPFGTLPAKASSSIHPFTIDFPDSEIKKMLDLLRLTPIAEENYENALPNEDRHLGVRRDWLIKAKEHWETKFDWFGTPMLQSHRSCEYLLPSQEEARVLPQHFPTIQSTDLRQARRLLDSLRCLVLSAQGRRSGTASTRLARKLHGIHPDARYTSEAVHP